MYRRISLQTFLLICLLAAMSCSNNRAEGTDYAATAYVEAVMDGDTVRVRFSESPPDGCSQVEKVRFIGVNTSELYTDPPEYFAYEAYEYTDSRLWHKTVHLLFDVDTSLRDKYGRLLAYVYSEDSDMSINEELLLGGYAEYYGYFDFNSEMMRRFQEDEDGAKKGKRGRWSLE